jgi:hypothetical protein
LRFEREGKVREKWWGSRGVEIRTEAASVELKGRPGKIASRSGGVGG